MKKLLVAVLLIALPLHFSWAVAASYCQHESDPTAHHFGHHTHQHHGSAEGSGDAAKSPLNVHGDCSICHLSCPAVAVSVQAVSVLVAGSLVAATPPDTLPSIVPDAPERPNWVPAA